MTPSKEEPAGYLKMPPEIAGIIISFIPRPSDLKSLCLTCQEVRLIASKNLYSTMRVNFDRYEITDLKGVFNTSNPGWIHVRSLVVTSHRSECMEKIREFLVLLARDQLKGITFPVYTTVDYATLQTLSVHHRSLESLVFSNYAQGAMKSMARLMEDLLEIPWRMTLRRLHMPYERFDFDNNREECLFYLELVKSYSNLHELQIPGVYTPLHVSELPIESNEEDTSRLPLLRNLLCNGTFDYKGRLITDLIGFTLLTSIKIDCDCRDPDSIFRALKTEYLQKPPALTTFQASGFECGAKDLNELLLAFTGLHVLYIDLMLVMGVSTDDIFDGISNHISSIQQLYIGPGTWNLQGHPEEITPSVLSQQNLHNLCANTEHLHQLSLCLPDISAEAADADIWGPFGNCIREITLLPSLKLLNIITLPQPALEMFESIGFPEGDDMEIEEEDIDFLSGPWDEEATPFSETFLPGLLNVFATRLVEYYKRISTKEGGCPVMFFGSKAGCVRSSPASVWRWLKYEPTAYFPSTRKDIFGREESYAIRVEGSLLKYLEPDCDVVNYALEQCMTTDY